MIIEYKLYAHGQCLVIECDDRYVEHEQKIKNLLDEAYCEWHVPDMIDDVEKRKIAENYKCEDYLMYKLSKEYPTLCKNLWNTFYYGKNKNKIISDTAKHRKFYDYNMSFINGAVKHIEGMQQKVAPIERVGNEAYWIMQECINKLKGLNEKYEM